MPLDPSSDEYENKKLMVWPIIGFGWSRIETEISQTQIVVHVSLPLPFRVKLLELHRFSGEITGGIGMVEEPSHLLNEQWIAFCIRDRRIDIYDFAKNPGQYNVRVGKIKPIIRIDFDVPMPQWMQFSGSECVSGIAIIAESEVYIKQKYEWLN